MLQRNERVKTVAVTLAGVGVLYLLFMSVPRPVPSAVANSTTTGVEATPASTPKAQSPDTSNGDRCVLTHSQMVAAAAGPPRAKRVYFDLGANNGDSVYEFFGMPTDDKPHDTAVLGGNTKAFGKDGEWDVWAFEANPHFTDSQNRLAERIRKEQPRLTLRHYRICGASTADGSVTFMEGTGLPGGSLEASAPSVTDARRDRKDWKQSTVPAVDIARVILENYRKEDHVVLKADIEGTEYKLLRHLMLRGVMPLIDELAVEFHHIAEFEHRATFEWILKDSGIKIHHWG